MQLTQTSIEARLKSLSSCVLSDMSSDLRKKAEQLLTEMVLILSTYLSVSMYTIYPSLNLFVQFTSGSST